MAGGGSTAFRAMAHRFARSRPARSTSRIRAPPSAPRSWSEGDARGVRVDSAAGWIYFTASPDAPTQLYLYRSRLDGSGKAERVTPAAQIGTHQYQVAPGGQFALHIFSTF